MMLTQPGGFFLRIFIAHKYREVHLLEVEDSIDYLQ